MELIYWNHRAVGVEFGPRILWFPDAPAEAKLSYFAQAYRPFPTMN